MLFVWFLLPSNQVHYSREMRLCTTTGGFRSSMLGLPRVASVCGVHPILYRSYAVPKDQVTQRVINIVKAFDKV